MTARGVDESLPTLDKAVFRLDSGLSGNVEGHTVIREIIDVAYKSVTANALVRLGLGVALLNAELISGPARPLSLS